MDVQATWTHVYKYIALILVGATVKQVGRAFGLEMVKRVSFSGNQSPNVSFERIWIFHVSHVLVMRMLIRMLFSGVIIIIVMPVNGNGIGGNHEEKTSGLILNGSDDFRRH
jgi:hypothetical protein